MVAALAVLLALAPPALAGGPASARLRDAAERYRAHLLEERPDLGSLAGLSRADAGLQPVTEATLERDAALLAALADSLARIDAGALAPAERATLDTLRARIGREAAPIASGRWRTDPDLYLALAHDAPMLPARRAHVSPCERARRAARRLRAVPEVLRSAEVNLGAAGAFDRAACGARWREAMMDLRTTLPALLDDCHDADRFADLVEADTLALDAARRFARFLAGPQGETPPAARAR